MTTASATVPQAVETMARPFVITALSETYLESIRKAGRDQHGNPLRRITVAADDAGSPLRCCLREATAGEQITLIAHSPQGGAGPYEEVGPVFIHADSCGGYDTPGHYPEGFRSRQQVFRAYDGQGRICDAIRVDSVDAEASISQLLSRPEITVVQSRNVLYGCFMFLISRSDA
jgi:hypothetical protein